MQKKVITLLLATMLVLGGCGQQTDQTDSSKQESKVQDSETVQSSATEQSAEVIEEEPPVITIAIQQDGNIVDLDTNYMTLLLEEKANVDIEFILFPADWGEFKQKLTMMVTAGSKLPDIIMDIDDADILTYGESGIIIPMTEYLSDPDAMPLFHANVLDEDKEYMIATYTQADGNIYGVPSYAPEIGNENPSKAWINTTWLEKLGLPMPETTDDLYTVLKAFKEKDPNGNGKQDEIPMIGATKGTGSNPLPFLMSAFVYVDDYKGTNNYLYVEDGKIVSAFTKEEWKKGLEFVNKLVSEDLLSPLSFTQDYNQLRAIVNSADGQIVGSFTRLSMSTYESGNPNATDMDVLPPITGPDGACYAMHIPQNPTISYFISKDCDNVDAAVRLLDAFYDKDIAMVSRYGEPEVDWTTNVGNAVSPYEDMGIETGFLEINSIWGVEQNKHWGGKNPRYVNGYDPYSIQGKGVAADTDPYSATVMTPKSIPYYQNKHPQELIYGLKFLEDETAEVTDLRTTITQYVKESMTRFATGDLSFGEWDNYLKTLNEMGLERYLELMQNGYDRYNGN